MVGMEPQLMPRFAGLVAHWQSRPWQLLRKSRLTIWASLACLAFCPLLGLAWPCLAWLDLPPRASWPSATLRHPTPLIEFREGRPGESAPRLGAFERPDCGERLRVRAGRRGFRLVCLSSIAFGHELADKPTGWRPRFPRVARTLPGNTMHALPAGDAENATAMGRGRHPALDK